MTKNKQQTKEISKNNYKTYNKAIFQIVYNNRRKHKLGE